MHAIIAALSAKVIAGMSSTALVYMLVSALVSNQPSSLPTRWRDIPQFCWDWERASAISFLSMRHGTPAATTLQTDTQLTKLDPAGGTVSQSQPGKSVIVTSPADPKEKV